jgi:XTP/dITP diphosphohydrolase
VKLFIVTSNPNKAREIRSYFQDLIEVEHVCIECPEYRHEDVGEIAKEKAIYAFSQVNKPLIVDDTAFCIDALSGFPGPYAAYVFNKLGNRGILKLMEGEKDRKAHFETAIAYADSSGVRVFRGTISGTLVEPRGKEGFGYDPIFEYEGKTLAEFPVDEKSRISHRARALANLREWLQSGRPGT